MNQELLQRVKEEILAHPCKFNMKSYVELNESCGTTMCIAGWAVHLTDANLFARALSAVEELGVSAERNYEFWDAFMKKAAQALKITAKQAERLFFDDEWPFELGVRYRKAVSLKEKAQVAAERIDLFIESKGRK